MEYQIFFLCFFFSVALLMKFVAYFVEKVQKRNPNFRFVFLSPLFSTKSYFNLRDQTLTKTHLFIKMSVFGMMTFAYFYTSYQFKNHFSNLEYRYLLAPGLYVLTLWMSASLQFFFSFTGVTPVDIHDRPYLAFSLTDFWSKRWNRWIRDWLNTLTFFLKMVNLKWGVFLSFLISGLFHEVMFTLPYFLFTGENYFGYMMAFFFLQALGVLFERTFLKDKSPWMRRAFLWIMILGLSPLFVQRPIMAVLEFNL